ncbi:2Fe-2S iron-sulfur cluster-binding protein [Streptosporangium soli]|nr:2Fe-2S iron-sulfur cluster-binding protein [Streptosporangium sp. KLBMP 9127]
MTRLATGGRIDRSAPLTFTFDGAPYTGYQGDTLASALLAAGVRTVATSIRYGRPRGIFAAGVEEPNALVEVDGEPMATATTVELRDGLTARSLTGRGRLTAPDDQADQAGHDRMHAHCDVLVVGAGPAGLTAALEAGRTGARVIVVDERTEAGGTLLETRDLVGDAPALAWVAAATGLLAELPEVRVLTRTTALGRYDDGYVVAAERRGSRGRLWRIRAAEVVLATGAHERPLVFAGNDLPGVMLAGAARAYANRYAVLPGRRAVVFTTDDSAYAAAAELAEAGLEIAAVVDPRPGGGPDTAFEVLAGHVVAGATGTAEVTGVRVAGREIACDLVLVCGGWNPVAHLYGQAGGRLRYDDDLACFVPEGTAGRCRVVGAAAGEFSLAGCLGEEPRPGPPAAPVWLVPGDEPGYDTHFVDLQRDVTVADIEAALATGMTSVEHVKRYTTAGTAHDQGKTSAVTAVGVISALRGVPMGDLGTTTFRPPYTPVSFALLAGRDRGVLHDPVLTTAMHPWHVARGAVFEDVGQWKRPHHYPGPGEDMAAAVLRECRAAREGVAAMDVSTLGKIDVQGPDAGEFLNRVYTNAFAKLPVGSCRYGVMCRADGMVFDDGVTMRLAPDRFLMSTTTGNAAAVLDWLEEWLQTEWPDLRVRCTSVTDQWAGVAVVGPRSRDVVAALAPGLVLDNAGFPFMTWRETDVPGAGGAARVARISFSGELAYEVYVPWWYGLALWEAVLAAGEPYGITPYGTETMHVLRAEKGYPIIGQDTDGTVTPVDLGLGWAVSKTKDFIGRRSLSRSDTSRPDRRQLVGLLPIDGEESLPEGAQLVEDPDVPVPVPMIGHVTSSYRSAALGATFALALVKGGRDRIGTTVFAPLGDRVVAARVADPVLYDKEGAHRDG